MEGVYQEVRAVQNRQYVVEDWHQLRDPETPQQKTLDKRN